MYCPNCNCVLSDNAAICTSCGLPVQKGKKTFSAPKKPMRWFYALILLFLPLSLLGYAYGAYFSLTVGPTWLVIPAAVTVFFCVYTELRLIQRRANAPKMLLLLFVLDTLLALLSLLCFFGPFTHDLVLVAVIGLVIISLNTVYFEKRSYYFEG